jgi:hypothetical protein
MKSKLLGFSMVPYFYRKTIKNTQFHLFLKSSSNLILQGRPGPQGSPGLRGPPGPQGLLGRLGLRVFKEKMVSQEIKVSLDHQVNRATLESEDFLVTLAQLLDLQEHLVLLDHQDKMLVYFLQLIMLTYCFNT